MGSKKKQKKEEKKEESESPAIKKVEDQSLDDFLETWADSDGEDDETNDVKPIAQSKEEKKKIKKLKKKKSKAKETDQKDEDDATSDSKVGAKSKEEKTKKIKKKKVKVEEKDQEEEEDEDESDSAEEEGEGVSGARDQTAYLARLKDKDPEFYDFLKENDEELLDFNESSDGEDDEVDEERKEKFHQLPDKLEVASDESDADEDDEPEDKADSDKKSRKKLKQHHLDTWTSELEKQPNLGTIGHIISAFRGAVATIGTEEEQEGLEYIVEGGTMFNGVVRMCVVNLQPALKACLKIAPDDSHYKPEKAKNWKKANRHVKLYLLELCKLMSRIVEPGVVTVLLKHVHQMIPFFQAFQKGAKQVLARLVSYWCQGEETVRILAFMCVVKLVRNTPLLENALKQMYLAYVKNCKFTSPSSLSTISFMRRSLVELMGLDHNLSYYHAFVYIRQLAIHLRNAITTNKKDSVQAVYNWQFIHSLELWGALLGHTSSSDALQPLIYPLVQVVLGTARLIATPKYFPLRFHCCKILTALSRSTGTFIPVLPFYLDVLNTFNFNKKSTKVSMKPIDFSCILKLSKSQLNETGFKDSTLGEVQAGLLAYLSDNSSKIGFPELVTPAIFQLKTFNKKCKVANYTKKIKQVLEKITSNQKFIETRRRTVKFSVADKPDIAVWEASVERDGTPLLAFYNSWNKSREIQHLKNVSQQEKMDDYSHIPNLKKNHKKIRMKMETEKEVGGFLDGDDSGDDSFDEEEQFKLKEERGKGDKRKHEDSDNSEEDEDDEDDEDDEEQSPSHKSKQQETKVVKIAEESGDENDSDVVEDLNLDDLDSDIDMDDEFDVSKDDGGNDKSSDSGSDEDSEDED